MGITIASILVAVFLLACAYLLWTANDDDWDRYA